MKENKKVRKKQRKHAFHQERDQANDQEKKRNVLIKMRLNV